jgi:acylphosphatase
MDEGDDRGPAPGRTSAHWLVAGKVQGVGFRYHVLHSARRFGVLGDVRNLNDGRVEIRAKGSSDAIDNLLAAVRIGPPWSRVESVETRELEEGLNFDTFMIR